MESVKSLSMKCKISGLDKTIGFGRVDFIIRVEICAEIEFSGVSVSGIGLKF